LATLISVLADNQVIEIVPCIARICMTRSHYTENKQLRKSGSLFTSIETYQLENAHDALLSQARFVQFLPTPPWVAISFSFQLTANLQILKHLIGWKRVAEQLLYLM
jgi:hypothetical protein